MKNFGKTNNMICRIIFVMASAMLMVSQAVGSLDYGWEVTSGTQIIIEREVDFAGNVGGVSNFELRKMTGVSSVAPDIPLTSVAFGPANNKKQLVVTTTKQLTHKQIQLIKEGAYALFTGKDHGLTDFDSEKDGLPVFHDADPDLNEDFLETQTTATVGEFIELQDSHDKLVHRQDKWDLKWDLNNDHGGALGQQADNLFDEYAKAGETAAIGVYEEEQEWKASLKDEDSNAKQRQQEAKKDLDKAKEDFNKESNVVSRKIYNLKFNALRLQDEANALNLTDNERTNRTKKANAAQDLLDKALKGSWEDKIYALEIDKENALKTAIKGKDKVEIKQAQKDYDDIIKAKKRYAVGNDGHPVHAWMEGVSNNQADDGLAKALTINYDLNMETRSVVSTFQGDITKNKNDIAINKEKIEKNFKAIKANTASIEELSDDVDVIRSGVAASLAVAAMPVLTREGWGVAVGTGYFDGESAIAAGLTYSSNAYHLKFAVGHSGGHNAASAGATWAF